MKHIVSSTNPSSELNNLMFILMKKKTWMSPDLCQMMTMITQVWKQDQPAAASNDTGDNSAPGGNKKKHKLSFDEYKSLTNMLVAYMRQEEEKVTSEGSSDSHPNV
ncbi:hypothetical protein WDU94_007440 [Cyamophila willieti]